MSPADDAVKAKAPVPETLLKSLQGLWQELPGLINDRIDLLGLEIRRAGAALLKVAALGAAAALLGVTAWFALWGAVVGGLVALGLHWSLGLLVVVVLCAAAALVAVKRLSKLLPLLQLPATRRHLKLTEPLRPEAQPSQADDNPYRTPSATTVAGPAAT